MNTRFQTNTEEKYVYKTWPELPENCNPKFNIGETVYFLEDGFYYEVESINFLGKDGEKEIFEYKLINRDYSVFEDQLTKPQPNKYYMERI